MYETGFAEKAKKLLKNQVVDNLWTRYSKHKDRTNRINRNKLENNNDSLVSSISEKDYYLNKDQKDNLDLFCILKK